MDERTLWRRVGWYEILAGAAGFGLTAITAQATVPPSPSPYRGQVLALFAGVAGVWAAVMFAGILLLRGHRWGRRLSGAVQLAQVPMWALGPSRWVFYAGAYLAPVVHGAGVGLSAGLKSNLQVQWAGAAQTPPFVGVNLVPVAVAWLLIRRAPTPAEATAPPAPVADAAPAA